MVFAMDSYNYNSGARNQHTTGGAYEFHIHRAYIIYVLTHTLDVHALSNLVHVQKNNQH